MLYFLLKIGSLKTVLLKLRYAYISPGDLVNADSDSAGLG